MSDAPLARSASGALTRAALRPLPQGERKAATLIHVPNPLMPEVGARMIEIAPGGTVSEAIERAGWELRYSTVLCRKGELVKRVDWDALRIIEGEIVSLVTVPQGPGGPSQVIGQIAMIALAVFAATVVGPAAASFVGATGILGSAVSAIAAAGVIIAGQALMSALLPGPKKNQLTGPDYALFNNSNAARIGFPIPEMFGQFMRYPDLASVPYSDWADNRQHLYQLFCVGIGEYQIDQLRVAQTVVYENGAVTGNYADLQVQIVPPGGSVTLFPGEVQTSTLVQDIEMLGTNQAGYGWIGPFVANAAGTECSQIDIDIGMPGGLYSVDMSGHILNAEVSFEFQAQLIDNTGAAIGPWFNLGISHTTLKMASRDAYYETLVCNVPPGRYQVQGERTNARSSSTSVSDLLIWVALRAFLPGPTSFPDCTMIAVRAAPSANLNGTSASQFNVIATRMLPIYDPVHGTWSANTATRSIAAAAAYLCKSDNAANLSDSQIDLATLFGTLDPIWAGRGDTCDGLWDQAGTFWDALTQVLRCGRAMPILAGEVISFHRDQAQTVYRTAFSPRNMLAGSFQVDYMPYTQNTPDAVWIKFMDSRIWQDNTVFCALPDSTANENDPTIPVIQWQGINNRSQAWREGIYTAASSRYRRAFPSWRTELDGRVCFKGDLVKVSHWLPQWGWSMEVLSCTADPPTGDILVLSEPWDIPAGDTGDTLLATLTTPDGLVYGPVTFSLLNDGSVTRQAQIQLTSTMNPGGRYAGQIPSQWPVWSGDGLQEERPMAMLGVASTIQQDCLVMQMRPERGQTATVVAVIDDARVYSADGSGPPAETNPPSGLAPENLTITGLVISRIALSSGAVIMYVTVVGAPNAVSFDAQWMWSDATNFTQPVKGLARTFQFQAEASAALTLQVVAVGQSGFGPTFTGTATSTGGGGSSGSAEDFATIVNLAGLATHLQYALDAGDSSSYSGSGFVWDDLTGAGNNFFLGSSGSAGSGDPTFHGTGGALAASDYFSSDGTDFFTLSVATPAWVQALHQNNGNFSVAGIIYFPGLAAPGSGNAFAFYPLFKTCPDAGNYGVAVDVDFESSAGPLYQGYVQVIKNVLDDSIGDVVTIGFYNSTTPLPAGWYFIGVSVNQSANIVTINVNGIANSVSGGLTMTPAADSHNADETLCLGTSAEPFFNGARIACAGAFDVALAGTDLAALYAQVKQYRPDFGLP